MGEITMNTTYAATVTENGKKDWTDSLANILATTYAALHFVPILTSIAWILYFATGQNYNLMYVLAPIIFIGLVSALITHPIRIIWFAVKRIAYALWRPLLYVPIPLNLVASAVCGGLTATLCIGLIVFAPGALTLYYFLEE